MKRAKQIIMDCDNSTVAVIEWSNDASAEVDSVGDVWYNSHWAGEEELVSFAGWLKDSVGKGNK